MGRFSWLGGSSSAKADTQSVRRAKAHRSSIPKATRAERAWDKRDRRLFGD